jgi:DNA modification methylase
VLDPFAGTGTTLVVAEQFKRKPIGIEIDSDNITCIQDRLQNISSADSVLRFHKDYQNTENLNEIWDTNIQLSTTRKEKSLKLFEA